MQEGKGKQKRRVMLIKKGTPHPGYPKYKLDSAHVKDKDADKRELDLLDERNVKATRRIEVKSKHLVYVQRSKSPRITPKTPRLRR